MAYPQPRRASSPNTFCSKRGIHAELHDDAPAESGAEVGDELPQKAHGLGGVVDIAGPVLQPQDVPGLREMSQERVVARVLPMVRVEAPEGPADRGAGADHGAIDVDGEARQRQAT